LIFGKIGKLFNKSQENIDGLNKVINESIVGSGLVRVLNSVQYEDDKFDEFNLKSKDITLKIVYGFAFLVPVIGLLSGLGGVAVIWFGGNAIIDRTLSIGDFQAFFAYIGTFITPVLTIGFLGAVFGRAFASYKRILEITQAKIEKHNGTIKKEIKGDIEFKNVNLDYDQRKILREVNFKIKSGTRTALLGPTASGKTQLFYLLASLNDATSGDITIDGINLKELDIEVIQNQIGLVFQDSIIFNASFRENISFNQNTSEELLQKAINTAELHDLIESLDKGLDTMISERGTTLSGGQKQRLTLARALALDPKILLLDDFTARVDITTEKRILENIQKNYVNTTLISITQKIQPVEDFDQIILIMEGEVVSTGKHKELLESSVEYQQIYKSQQTTNI
jgi:ATP-binding cassette subfamily B protein